MATYKTGWLRLPTDAKDFKERFAWSHVKAIFYDKAKNILLKDKLDAMDKLISDHADAIANKLMTNDAFNTAIADYVTKSMMSGVQVNDGDHVPTSALAYAMQQAITANANAITRLNSDFFNRIDATKISLLTQPSGTTIRQKIENCQKGTLYSWAHNSSELYNPTGKNGTWSFLIARADKEMYTICLACEGGSKLYIYSYNANAWYGMDGTIVRHFN